MKKTLLTLAIAMVGYGSYAQNAPLYLWGTGLDGSTYQTTAIYSDAINGLLLEAPLSSTGTKLPITLSWRGGGSAFSINPIGNVGIGTTSPQALLDVNGSYYLNRPSVMVDGGITLGTPNYINLVPTSMSASNAAYAAIGFPSNSTVGIYTDYDGHILTSGTAFRDIQFGRRTEPYLTVKDGGNVGIGTTTPDAKLAVKGTIHTQEVKVDMNGWNDFVFDKTYPLATLSSVKTYIDQNHHLPELPSEAEVIKNGVNLGEMVKLQTKKIEELTLYLIDKDKQLSNQQKQMEQQEARIAALEKMINK